MQRLRHKWHKSHRDTGQLVSSSDKTFYNMFSCVFMHPKYSILYIIIICDNLNVFEKIHRFPILIRIYHDCISFFISNH